MPLLTKAKQPQQTGSQALWIDFDHFPTLVRLSPVLIAILGLASQFQMIYGVRVQNQHGKGR